MKRSEVELKYKWNLDDIFYNVGEWEKEFSALNKDMVKILSFKGKLGIKESLLECFKFQDDISKRIEKLYCYAMLKKDENAKDEAAQTLNSRAETLVVQYGSLSSFVTPEISALDNDTLESFIADPDFSNYDYALSCIVREKKHILSAAEERILALGGKTFSSFREIFHTIDSIDLPLPVISVGGKREQMTHGKYSLWLQNPDAEVRKKAFKAMYSAVESLINTLAANYASAVNKDNFLANVRGYKSAMEKSLGGNDVPAAVYETLVKKTSQNLDAVHSYVALRKKVLNAETLHMYDLYVPMFENADISCDYEEAFETVLNGLAPMGEEYASLLKKARDERWIDVCETDNKRSGAYSCGVYGVHPYVLLNYARTTHDIFTIAHELGHSMHSYYSSKNQPYAKNDYAIFVAEVASTVNEVLLLKYLISRTTDKNLKKYLLSYYLDTFRTTLFRQTMFAEFEAGAHKAEAGGQPLTVETLCKMYMKLNKKYYGPAVKHDKQIRMEWARIPHFYSAFYVYQYSTGLVSAVNIANSILSGGKEAFDSYKKFLSAGGCKSPYEILKDCGVDLMTDYPYEVAFGEFRDTLKELETLCE